MSATDVSVLSVVSVVRNDTLSPANTQLSDFGLPTWRMGSPKDLFLRFSSASSTFHHTSLESFWTHKLTVAITR
ncbi:Protein of unknown function [Pyronema omphalodes CBS 100304]|uniref:Uncharacterized protein n=1 Tax=Pyronema omphalodes (strain CBS 100304) TaxID=1076935 RepID=U4KUB0_PYROM|nr:Protein of unknown function [Pyronema omphalodes CBS 100304]